MEKLLTHKEYQLQKFPGKGGWTYAEIPEVPMDKHAHFGWVCVKGHIDGYPVNRYHLMPMGNGKLFLPVKAEIRKKIKKSAGDWVTIELYADNSTLIIPPDLEACLKDEPLAHKRFVTLSESEQKEIIDWVEGAKKEETKAERIVKTIDLLLKGASLRIQRTRQAEGEL